MRKRPTMALMVVSVLIALALTAGCGFLRDLSTPASRLVGHWITDKGDEYYFGRQVAGEGTLIHLPPSGEKRTLTYQVLEQDKDADTVTIEMTFGDGTTEERIYRIPGDGIFMREQSEDVPDEEKTDYIYVDTNTEPTAYEQTRHAEGE